MILPALTQWWPGGGGGEAPDLRPGLEESDITPGIEGFLFTALIAFLLVIVVRDLVKRMRRMKYRTQIEAEIAGEEPEFPGELTPAEISESQQRARDAAAAQRFGAPQGHENAGPEAMPHPETVQSTEPEDDTPKS